MIELQNQRSVLVGMAFCVAEFCRQKILDQGQIPEPVFFGGLDHGAFAKVVSR